MGCFGGRAALLRRTFFETQQFDEACGGQAAFKNSNCPRKSLDSGKLEGI
jgi:hypothetical protein